MRCSLMCVVVSCVCAVGTVLGPSVRFGRYSRTYSFVLLRSVVGVHCVASHSWFCLAYRSYCPCLSSLSRRSADSHARGPRGSRNERDGIFVHEAPCAPWSLMCGCCFAFSWCAFLFDGTTPRSPVTGPPMIRRLRRCLRSCSPRGGIASIVAGARFCGGLLVACWVPGMLFWTAPRSSSSFAAATCLEPICSPMPSSRCLY